MTAAAVAASRGPARAPWKKSSTASGGTTRSPGAMAWNPGKFQMEKVGSSDSARDAACAESSSARTDIFHPHPQAFLDHGDRAIGHLEDQTASDFETGPALSGLLSRSSSAVTLGGRAPEPEPIRRSFLLGLASSACCIRRLQSRHYSAAPCSTGPDIPHLPQRLARSLAFGAGTRKQESLARDTWQWRAHPARLEFARSLGNASPPVFSPIPDCNPACSSENEIPRSSAPLVPRLDQVGGGTVKKRHRVCANPGQTRVRACIGGLAQNAKLRQRDLPAAGDSEARPWQRIPVTGFLAGGRCVLR